MTDYESGRIYKATVRGVPDQLVAFTEDFSDGSFVTFTYVKGDRVHGYGDVTDVRGPLVVLDLDAAPTTVRQVVDILRDDGYAWLADQIEAQEPSIWPPKPEEPTETGSLVKDRDGELWVRHSNGVWSCLQSPPGAGRLLWDELTRVWSPIEVVR